MEMSLSDLDRMIVNKINLINGNDKEPDQDPHMTLRKNLPSGVNFAKCEGDDCGHVKLQNPQQTTSWKACPNCKNNNVPDNFDYCPVCGIEDRNDIDFWGDSDVGIGR